MTQIHIFQAAYLIIIKKKSAVLTKNHIYAYLVRKNPSERDSSALTQSEQIKHIWRGLKVMSRLRLDKEYILVWFNLQYSPYLYHVTFSPL